MMSITGVGRTELSSMRGQAQAVGDKNMMRQDGQATDGVELDARRETVHCTKPKLVVHGEHSSPTAL